MKTITKQYSNDELTVVWQPHLCIHAENCVKMLPKVYNPEVRPWIKVENATTNELKTQVDACPSGALSYKLVNATQETAMVNIKIEAKANGPLIVKGDIEIVKADGNTEFRTKMTAFCRCGASENKPFCDGSHSKIGFEG